MTTYFVVLFLVLIFSYLANKSCKTIKNDNIAVHIEKTRDTNIFLVIIVAILTLTAGLRYYVGADYGNYVFL